MCLKWLLLLSSSVAFCFALPVNTDSSNDNTIESTEMVCPLWTLPTLNGTCECGDRVNGLTDCRENEGRFSVSIPYCYCMTYNNALTTAVLGHCMFTCQLPNTVPGHSQSCSFHYRLITTTNNTAEINENVCKNLNMHRTGQLCGKCEEGYGLPVYSYSMACVECSEYKYNWLKYIVVGFLPLTLFYFLIIIFRISATAGTLNAYIMLCQFSTSETILLYFSSYHSYNPYFIAFSSIHAIWNLDFFLSAYTPFCLHPRLSSLQLLALNYVIAVYPLMLIAITYVFATLHYRYSFIVRVWKPFYRCFFWIRKEWEIKTSLISAFCTFLLLSYVKILTTSFNILTPTVLYNVHGEHLNSQYVYRDGTTEYFGKEHIPYALLALFMLLVFNILPALLLMLYPCRCFHKCLNNLRLESHTLYIFMDTFQGQYKIKPRDCRYFSALYLVIRMISVALLCLTNGVLYFPAIFFVLTIMNIVLALSRPYKYQPFNVIEILFFSLLTLVSLAYPLHVYSRLLSNGTKGYHLLNSFYAYIVILPLLLYEGGLLMYNIIPQRIIKIVWSKYKTLKENYTHSPTTDESMPYRFEHMDEYTPII